MPSGYSTALSSLYGGAGSAGIGGTGGVPRISISPLFGSGSQSYYSYLNPYGSSYGSGSAGTGSGGLKSVSSLMGGKLGLGLGLAGLSLLG